MIYLAQRKSTPAYHASRSRHCSRKGAVGNSVGLFPLSLCFNDVCHLTLWQRRHRIPVGWRMVMWAMSYVRIICLPPLAVTEEAPLWILPTRSPLENLRSIRWGLTNRLRVGLSLETYVWVVLKAQLISHLILQPELSGSARNRRMALSPPSLAARSCPVSWPILPARLLGSRQSP
jgi:hypothetical protein